MKELFVQYVTYHVWANNQFVFLLEALTPEQWHKPIQSSFDSIFKTVLHMWDADSIWWQRIKLQERIEVPSEYFDGDIIALTTAWQKQGRMWLEWINNISEHGLQHEFIYLNKKKERFKQPVYQMLLHLFNHGTYHRGQLVTMLRQTGIEKIPATDFIVWSRKR